MEQKREEQIDFLQEEENIPRSRSKHAQDGQQKKKRKKTLLIVVGTLLVLLIATCLFAWFYIQNMWNKMEMVSFNRSDVQTNDLSDSVLQASEGYTTIMLYGVDARNNSDLLKNANADTDMICCINNETKEIKLVSILRDTFMETTTNRHTKLTNVYSGYGVQESLQTINRNLDLNITQYVTVNWKAVAQAVDILGGLDIEMSKAEAKATNNYIDEVISTTGISSSSIEEVAGTHHLDGVQTVAYARVRSVGNSDITRTQRQRTVILAMLEVAKKASLTTLNKLCNEVFPGISTNFTFSEVLELALDVSSYTIADQALFPFSYVSQQGGSYYIYSTTLVENVEQLHYFLYGNENYEPSSTVETISQYITTYAANNP